MIAWNEISKTTYIIAVNCPVTVEKWNQNYVFQVMPNTWQTSSEECKAYASEECNKYRPDHKHCYNKTTEEEDLERYNWFPYLFLCRFCKRKENGKAQNHHLHVEFDISFLSSIFLTLKKGEIFSSQPELIWRTLACVMQEIRARCLQCYLWSWKSVNFEMTCASHHLNMVVHILFASAIHLTH